MTEKYKISDVEHYVSEMKKPLADKLWFLEHVWVESMLDIGTADATIPIHLSDLFKHDFKCYAYEPDYNLYWMGNVAANATNNNGKYEGRVFIYNKFREYLNVVKSKKQIDLINLSSVLHEVYNGYSGGVIDLFRIIKESDARYISIRDMKLKHLNFSDSLYMEIPEKYKEKWQEWQECHDGAHDGGHDCCYDDKLIQFLLKYRYDVNWEAEVREDYFATDWDEIDKILRILGYKKVMEKNYTPDFIKNDVQKTFDFSFDNHEITTHTNILYRFD